MTPPSGEAWPWVIAHRGASADFPENTRIAFDEALRQGCDGLELDVQLSRDEVPVVYHDRTLARVGGGSKRVSRMDRPDLARLDAGGWLDNKFRGQHIASLEEILEEYGSRTRLLIEIKAREGWWGRARHVRLARSVALMVERMNLVDNVLILSFDTRVLGACAESVPALRRVLNLRPPAVLDRRLEAILSEVAAFSTDIRGLTREFGAAVRSGGRLLLAYTCNEAPEVDLALDAGAAAIMSDRPGWLAGCLRTRRRQDGA